MAWFRCSDSCTIRCVRPRTNLHALRAFAVTAVLLAHVTSLFGSPVIHGWDCRWLGVFGVYLFFVHTCLVLMWSLERRPNTLDFYIRRVFRIYPLAIVTILILLGFRISYMYGSSFPSWERTVSNLLLVQNIWQHQDLMGTLWSLPLEVDMYLLLPVFFAFARRESSIWTMLLIWLFACLVDRATYGKHAGNTLFMVVPHFLPGVIAYIGFRTQRVRLPAWGLALSIALVVVLFMRSPNAEKGWFACLVVGLLLPLFRDAKSGLVEVLTRKIATYSYGIYLLHFICLWLCLRFLGGRPLWLQVSTALVLTCVSAAGAYHLIEEPLIRVGNRVAEWATDKRMTKLTKRDLGLEVAP